MKPQLSEVVAFRFAKPQLSEVVAFRFAKPQLSEVVAGGLGDIGPVT